MERRLITPSNPLLRKVATKVNTKKGIEIGRELIRFIEDYNNHVKYKRAVGLAAPQLGVDAAVCVVADSTRNIILINPQIVRHSESKLVNVEGCLSLPGVKLPVFRYSWVEVQCDNLPNKIYGLNILSTQGRDINVVLSENYAVQHEIAHLYGKLIFDFQKPDYPTPQEWADWQTEDVVHA
jgi:peptide deformylase